MYHHSVGHEIFTLLKTATCNVNLIIAARQFCHSEEICVCGCLLVQLYEDCSEIHLEEEV